MPKFLFLFKGLGPGALPMTESYAQKWAGYIGDLAQKGRLESASPLEGNGKVVVGSEVSDFKGEKVDIYGYMLVKASSLEEAVEISKKAPHMALGGTTIVRPCRENP